MKIEKLALNIGAKKDFVIGLTYDLRKDYLNKGFSLEQVAEFDSDETIEALEGAINSLGFRTERIGNVWALCEKLAAGKRWDLVFNIAEGMGGRGRESQVPALLEAYNIGYTFSDPLVCALTLDKAMAKRIVRSHSVATPDFAVISNSCELENLKLRYPLFAKPIAEGTSKGIDRTSFISNPQELENICSSLLGKFEQPVLVEEYLPGREFTVGMLGTGREARVLGIMEVVLNNNCENGVYTQKAKEECDTLVTYSPCRGNTLAKKIEKLALNAFRALECRDGGRVDVRCDAKGEPCFIEVNPLPGLHPTHSDLPMIATWEGVSYRELIEQILTSSLCRLSGEKKVSSLAVI